MTAPLLTPAEVAGLLNTSQRHVRRLQFERRIPFVKVGRYVRFRPADVERFITQNTEDAVR